MVSLPDKGREKVREHSIEIENIPDTEDQLNFLRANPSAMKGSRTSPVAWLFDNSKGSKTSAVPLRETRIQRQMKTPSQTPRRSLTPEQEWNQKLPKIDSIQEPQGPSQLVGRNNAPVDVCKERICGLLNRKHTDAQCFRHTNPAKFDELNKKQLGNRSGEPERQQTFQAST